MSPQETQTLQQFLDQLTQVRGINKDAQAEAMIAAAVARQPDAAYLLTQRALLVEQALTTSQAQVASLQNQVQALQSAAAAAGTAAAPTPGFLDGNAWGHAPAAPMRANPSPSYAPPAAPGPAPTPMATPYQAPPAASPGFLGQGGGMGSMLGTVAATAAGVAGGAFLFQGIEHLMNGGSGAGLAHQNGLNSPTETIENTTVNNYYGSDADKTSAQDSRSSQDSDNASDNDLADLGSIDLDDSGGYDNSMV